LALIERCIEACTHAGDLVVDPFCGSGTTALASLRLGRRFLGGDIDPLYANLAARRLRDEESTPNGPNP
jgi:site-specific DNA-methyltransferase (adenine-specific)